MKKTGWKEPYKKVDGKIRTNFRNTYKKSGVYIIKDKKTNKILYVGGSSNNVYRTMYRHYQEWSDQQKRATYKKFGTKVRVILGTKNQAYRLERYLTKKLDPRDIDYKYRQLELDLKDKKVIDAYKEAENIPF
tara:strand:- start:1861 stop:2259 length:399 start_codon:yes stop_codon:yes gene_type:complete